GEEIMGLIKELNDKGNTIIIVTHEEDVAKHANRIVKIRDGMIESDTKR
ncbi:MAG: macrolide ABC transporter ATP-binding protein, partial [Ignavibacteriae bacterium]|nr:macrolide ABC transporter ATP-binding protein [Ignavibacteriota bacterium]